MPLRASHRAFFLLSVGLLEVSKLRNLDKHADCADIELKFRVDIVRLYDYISSGTEVIADIDLSVKYRLYLMIDGFVRGYVNTSELHCSEHFEILQHGENSTYRLRYT